MAGKITFKKGTHPSRVGGWVQPVKLTDAQLASLGSYVGRPITADERAQHEALLETAPATAERDLQKLAQAAQIEPADYDMTDLRIHDLRRTLGSWQAKTGASLAIIGKSLNHKTHQATQIYARLDLDPVRQSVNTATTAMLEAAGMKQAADVLPFKKAG